ncbi:MAG: ATP synthase F1 subunit delta [Sphingomonadales bacterium]|nr:ATP synthase F1 subunit delta [Sphingomonadales bacterium]
MKIASRYAKCLFDIAVEKKQLDAVAGDVGNLLNAIASSSELASFLESPLLHKSKKKEVLRQICKGFNEISLSVFDMMADKSRENLLGEMAESFISIYNKANGITLAEVTSAIALDKDTLAGIEQFVKNHAGSKQVVITQKVNSALIGGLTILFDGRMYDSSVIGQINKMKKELNLA